MELITIKSVLDDESLTGSTVTVAGWVRTFRNDRFIALNDGSTIRNLQCVIDQEKVDPAIRARFTTSASVQCISAFLIGLLSQGKNSIVWDLIALVCGSASVFLLGVTGLKLKLGLSIPAAIAAGFLPFIPFNIAKMLAAATVARITRPFLQKNGIKRYDAVFASNTTSRPSIYQWNKGIERG